MLRLKAVSVKHGHIRAVEDVDIEVEAGEIISLLGANGAGKTSTLMAISGIYPIASGEIWFEDNRLDRLSPEEIVRRGISHVPEGRRVFPGLTVAENLRVGAYLRKIGSREFRQELDRVYSIFPRLRERHRQRAGTLSGGEQQMLAIGRALMAAPRLLLLDEPSLGLAPRLVQEIFAQIRAINEQGTSILVVEQNVRIALANADRGYVLENGRITLKGTAAELQANPRVQEAYLGRHVTMSSVGTGNR